MQMKRVVSLGILTICAAALALAQDISGKWTTKFDSPVGEQSYTYTFKLSGTQLTGRATSNLGDTEIAEGKVEGDTVHFVENLSLEGMVLKITYTGKIVGDEIRFTRNVADFGDEQMVAKRAK
jgi:hypothetical protein